MNPFKQIAQALFMCCVLIASARAQRDTNLVSVIHDLAAPERTWIWTDGIHPFLETTFSPPNNGYGNGLFPTVGAELQWKHLLTNGSATYGFTRKVNDGAQVPNEKGHTRGVRGDAFFLLGKNYFGGGARWGETAVTPYRKYASAAEVAAGHEWNALRLQFTYYRDTREYTDYPTPLTFTPGPGQPEVSTYCMCSNSSSGYSFEGWLAPTETGHFRYLQIHYNLTASRFHTSVTDPYNLYLTAQQAGDRMTTFDFTAGLVYRR